MVSGHGVCSTGSSVMAQSATVQGKVQLCTEELREELRIKPRSKSKVTASQHLREIEAWQLTSARLPPLREVIGVDLQGWIGDSWNEAWRPAVR